MALVGVIWNSCSPDMATAACASFSNSTNAMPGRASTMRTCAPRRASGRPTKTLFLAQALWRAWLGGSET